MSRSDRKQQSAFCGQGQPSLADVSRIADLAWAAGFVDGEGCLQIARQRYRGRPNPSFRPLLAVTQNHRPTLQRLQQVLGGGGHICPMQQRPQNRRPIWLLQYFGRHAINALRLLRPYLVRKGRLEFPQKTGQFR